MDLGLSNQREPSFKDGCLSIRQSVLERQRARVAPGPIYNPDISKARRSTLRDITFGVPDINKRPTSAPGRRRVQQPGPGPMTYDPNSIRQAVMQQSSKKNPPSVKFGTGKRACNTNISSSKATPSPAEYDPEAIRKGLRYTKAGAPSVHFGRSQSAQGSRKNKTTPGPSDYCPKSIRRGIMSTKSSVTGVKFGDPDRPQRRGERTKQSPSAQEYDTEAIRRGVYSLSTKRRPSGVRFATGPRTYNDAEERERASKPGPGTYSTGIRSSLGEQVNSRYRTNQGVSFGAR